MRYLGNVLSVKDTISSQSNAEGQMFYTLDGLMKKECTIKLIQPYISTFSVYRKVLYVRYTVCISYFIAFLGFNSSLQHSSLPLVTSSFQ